MSDLTTIYLVRHGKTEWNESGKIQGHLDSPLTKAGKDYLKEVAMKFKDIKFDYIFSSDLGRAVESAKILAENHDLVIKTSKLLREREYGDMDGTPTETFKAWDSIMEKLSDDERYTYKHAPNIESNEEIVQRFMEFIREASILEPNKTILIVTHGGLIRAILIKLGFGTYEELRHGAVKNGSWVKIETDGIDFFVKEHEGIKIEANTYA